MQTATQIKASELRIGNWVETYNQYHPHIKRYEKVESVNSKGINLTSDTEYDGTVIIPDTCWNPIPLTPEILEKAGFKDGRMLVAGYEVEYRSKAKIIVIWGTDGCTEGHNVYFPCEFMHQFQNIAYALAGEELNIEL